MNVKDIEKNISIILVSYQSTDYIFEILNELRDYSLIISDNGNSISFYEKIKLLNLKKIHILDNKKNIGYGAAINRAFNYIKTDFFLVLNSDLVIKKDDVVELCKTLIRYKNCAVAAPVSINEKDFYGHFPEHGKNIVRNSDQLKCCDFLKSKSVSGDFCADVIKGSCLMFRSIFFSNISKFDERFFLFWEEIDLCRRFRKNKLATIINPKVRIEHFGGKSAKKSFKTNSIRIFYSELSPMVYYNSKISFFYIFRIVKYIFRCLSNLLILNLTKSYTYFLKFIANIYYFYFKKSKF